MSQTTHETMFSTQQKVVLKKEMQIESSNDVLLVD